MPKGESKRSRLAAWIAEHQPGSIGETELDAIRNVLAPVSDRHLRTLLRHSGLPLDPLIEGVVQDDFESLERTLRGLTAVYETGDHKRARQCVLRSKEHARWALKRPADDERRTGEKHEMLLWMQVWLENPALFPVWVQLRKGQLLDVD